MVVLKKLDNMFWGLTIDGGRRYSQMVDRPFHVSMAALESSSDGNAGHVQLMLQQESSKFLLCTLGHGPLLQQQLDLRFSSGESVEFFLVGRGVVHLTGFLVEEDDKEFEDDFGEDEYDSESDPPNLMAADDSEDDEEDEDWDPEEEPVGLKRKVADKLCSKNKRLKITELNFDEDDEDDEDYDSSFIDDKASGEEEEESVEEEEEGDDESFIDDLPTKSPQAAKKINTPNTSSESLDSKKKKKKKKGKSPKTNESQVTEVAAGQAGDATNGDATAKKKKKKKKKKKHMEDGGEPQPSSVENEKPAETPSPKPTPPVGKKRTVAGGTSVEDVKIGHGPEAKPGKTVRVYYSGVLAKNNKRFDSCLKGKPFSFRLGRGEVIKGWDTGVIGMKVGGKRKITVPPSQGYGNARQGPIPAGSTLVFEVELKTVN